MNRLDDPWFARAFLLSSALCLIGALGVILYPFLPAVSSSATLALVLFPLKRRLVARAPERSSPVSAALTLATLLVLLLPLAIVGGVALAQARDAYPSLREWARVDLQDYLQTWGVAPRNLVLDNFDAIGAWANHAVRAAVGNAALIVVNWMLFGALLFFFLRDGSAWASRVAALVPLPERQTSRVLDRVTEVLRATLRGIFLVAVVQGVFAWIGFSLFGAPFPVLLAALCMTLSPVPVVGGALVWAPVVAKIAWSGNYAGAVPLLLWFSLVYSFVDNLVRPLLIGAQTRIPAPLVLIGVLGGVRALGFAGLFLGPALVAVGLAATEIVRDESA